MNQYRVLIAAYPFCESKDEVVELFEGKGITVVRNPHGRIMNQKEIADIIQDVDAVIAGTEGPYGRKVIEGARRLKAICRIGSGYDNIDLAACREHNVVATYTPNGPVQGVAELTIAAMINLSRHIVESNRELHGGKWKKLTGHLLSELTIGVVGVGRIGKRVCQLLQPFAPTIIAHDLIPDYAFGEKYQIKWGNKKQVFRDSDLITLHISYNENNYHYVDREAISLMKRGAVLINTSRGLVIDEEILCEALKEGHIAAAALDVFEQEPYQGPLTQLDNVILTPHMGVFANKCLYSMRVEACEECIGILSGQPPRSQVLST